MKQGRVRKGRRERKILKLPMRSPTQGSKELMSHDIMTRVEIKVAEPPRCPEKEISK